MSETVSRGQEASQQGNAGQHADAMAVTAAGVPRRRGRGRYVAAGIVVVLAAGGAAAAWYEGVFAASSPHSGQAALPPPTGTRTVIRRDLSAQMPVTASLGYAGSYRVAHGSGTLTSLPSQGQVISQGGVLYKTGNGNPVVLLYGSVPFWRTLDEGVTGADVTQLNHDLVALRYASSSDISSLGWDYFSWATKAGVEKLQAAVGISSPSGSLTMGSAVFEPTTLRISSVQGSLGGSASGPVLTATSDKHVVTISLAASQQSEVKAGDKVTITLPDGSVTPGVISSVGTVASGSSSSATIPVTVTLTHPQAAGTLDQAPVTVEITTGSVSNVLVVPVGALLAQSSGGYAVEVIGPGNTRRLVPVKAGIFDDTKGLVQVTGALTPGQQVVVPTT
jgi:hypothetical protein